MTAKQFVHLNVHSEYAITDSTIRIAQLVKTVRDMGMPAVALTDTNNLFAALKFYNAAKSAGIKPIFGADISVHNPALEIGTFEMTLLCQNRTGYLNLSRIISQSQRQSDDRGQVYVEKSFLLAHSEGLLLLADSMVSDFGRLIQQRQLEAALQAMLDWKAVFGDRFYVALAAIKRAGEQACHDASLYMAANQDIPLVATGRCRFLQADDFEAHEARVCINSGHIVADNNRPHDYTEQQYLKSPDEMADLFSDYPSLLSNTYHIAQRCSFDFDTKDYYLPDFPVPEGETIDSYFANLCRSNLTAFLQSDVRDQDYSDEDYKARLELEIKVILDMGFPGYFLIVSDFIRWSKDNKIPVGPGRGSGAGSLVAYMLKITALDPLTYELLFERFLNPERISMPDFDVDFCMDRRDEVIAYVADKYGKEKVSQIITFGAMNAKAVVRDAGRVLGYPYPVTDGIAKLIPNDLGMTLKKAMKAAPDLLALYEDDDEAKEIIDLSYKLEGLKRNVGKHAGGVVIAPSAISDFCPIYIEQQSQSVVCQFDKDDVESIGLVKFDFLGLRTLTIIDWAVQAIAADTGKQLDIEKLPLDDAKTFQLMRTGNTTSVFQLESPGMQSLIGRLKPDSFEDIIALVALYRPGPLDSGMVDTFVKCKHGLEKPNYMHDDLTEILEPTYGVILYQEQVMQIAQVLANFTLGGADILRKAMGKKIHEVMEQQKQVFIDGAVERGVDGALAAHIFSQIETFAGYGFNKSHSAAYALVAYQTAYLKAHYPVHFMAAVLSADLNNTDKIVKQLYDIRSLGICLNQPDVNKSFYRFKAIKGAIQYGLGAIKGVGEGAIEDIVHAREQGGPFKSFSDLCGRVSLNKVNKRSLEALIKAGAFDSLHDNRSQLLDGMEQVVKASEQQNKDKQSGQFDLFGGSQDNSTYADIQLPPAKKELKLDRLLAEKSVLGLFLSGHPIDVAWECLQHVLSFPLGHFHQMKINSEQPREFRVLGMVSGVRPGFRQKMKLLLNDNTGDFDFTLSPQLFSEYEAHLSQHEIVMVSGEAGLKSFKGRDGEPDNEVFVVSVKELLTLDQALAMYCNHICLVSLHHGEQLVDDISDLCQAYGPGKTRLYVHYRNQGEQYNLELGEEYGIRINNQFIEEALSRPSIQKVLAKK
ncbi:DNA polymerase III subunit alpha [Marinicella gelatinilytica]|uniref:DNA polymerase III subunit alpha n=1 Tax=Marinicella gelatinilytica TaxID=2996017 RepID=UPI0022608508|nr:DNA polymerase III subunit alpha [Marinicella gelatinilytica]MCX7544316.1 DNA polymerase III subunit alpha [Marinicella gelatinilytica]